MIKESPLAFEHLLTSWHKKGSLFLPLPWTQLIRNSVRKLRFEMIRKSSITWLCLCIERVPFGPNPSWEDHSIWWTSDKVTFSQYLFVQGQSRKTEPVYRMGSSCLLYYHLLFATFVCSKGKVRCQCWGSHLVSSCFTRENWSSEKRNDWT